MFLLSQQCERLTRIVGPVCDAEDREKVSQQRKILEPSPSLIASTNYIHNKPSDSVSIAYS